MALGKDSTPADAADADRDATWVVNFAKLISISWKDRAAAGEMNNGDVLGVMAIISSK